MRKTIIAILILAGVLCGFESQAQQKTRLTDEQIANRIPAGIMRARPAVSVTAGAQSDQMPALIDGCRG